MSKSLYTASMRKFLNPQRDGDTASVAVTSDLVRYNKHDAKTGKKIGVCDPYLEINDLEIRSCRHEATLHFSVYKPNEIKKRRQKLQILRDALDLIEAGLDRYEAEITKDPKRKGGA